MLVISNGTRGDWRALDHENEGAAGASAVDTVTIDTNTSINSVLNFVLDWRQIYDAINEKMKDHEDTISVRSAAPIVIQDGLQIFKCQDNRS